MEKQIDRVAEMKDVEGFFPDGKVSVYLENCYAVTFTDRKTASRSNMDYWECNGFDLVEFGMYDGKLTATFNVNKRRLMRGIVKLF